MDTPTSSTFMSGVCYARSTIKIRDLRRGTAHTLLAGEKYLNPDNYATGLDNADNETLYTGQDNDNYRSTGQAPMRDQRGNANYLVFGSVHATSFHCLFCDGSVRGVSYDVDPNLFRILGLRQAFNAADNLTVDASIFGY